MLRLDPENKTSFLDTIDQSQIRNRSEALNYYESENFSLFYDNLSTVGLAPTDFLTKEPLPLDVAKEIATTLYQRYQGDFFTFENMIDIDPQIVALEDLGPNIKYDKDELLASGKAVQITDSWGDTKTYCSVKSVPDLIPTFNKEQYNARIEPINNYNELVSLFGKEKQDQLFVSRSDPDAFTKIYKNLKSISHDFLKSEVGRSLNINMSTSDLTVGLTANLLNQISPKYSYNPAKSLMHKDLASIINDNARFSNYEERCAKFTQNIENAFSVMANTFNQRAVFLEKQQEVQQQQQLPAAEPKLPAAEPKLPAAEPKLPAAEPKLPAAEPKLPATEPKGFVQNVKLAYDKLANNINAVAEKFANKIDFAVQALSKTRLALTTKNLAIEQSKDKQQTVQPQKNTPEVKQQSKAKDMER